MPHEPLETRTTPTDALGAYAALDLAPGSTLDKALMDELQHEHAPNGRLTLTDDLGIDPSGLTPRMMNWFKTNIAALRLRALSEMIARFESDSIEAGSGRGRLLEAELDRLEQSRLQFRSRTIAAFWRDAAEKVRERDQRRMEYTDMRAEMGRDPVRLRPIVYAAGLLVVLILEGLINFESFLKAPFISSPILALGATLLVAGSIAAAGHIHGELLRQSNHFFGPHSRERNWEGAKLGALGGFLFSIGMILAGGARYYIILGEQAAMTALGEAPPSMAGSMTTMLMGNLIVYGLGVFWSYFHHDANPEFPKAEKAYLKAQEAFDRAYQKEMKQELDRADEKHRQDVEKAHQFERSQRGAPRYALNRDAFASFSAADKAVEGALLRYRAALVQALRKDGAEPVFQQSVVTEDDGARLRVLDASDLLAQPIQLKLISNVAE